MPLGAENDPLSQWLSGEGVALLDALTCQAPDVIAVLDEQLIVRYVNWAVPPLTREDVVGASVKELVPPEYRETICQAYQRVLQTGSPDSIENVYRTADGDLHLWDVRVGPIRLEGEVIGLIAITTNVTEQRRAQADRDRFFSLSLDMLVVANPEGRVKRANPAFGETLGYDVADLMGKFFIDFVHPDDQARALEAFGSLLAGSPIIDFENRYRRRDGSYRVLSWRAKTDPVTGDVYAVARDITDHREIEAQLRHSQKLEALGQLAGGVAHDFNNLMLAVLANAELALDDASVSAELVERLRDIQAAGQRAADLTKQLLAFSRAQTLRPVAVDLDQLTRGMMKMVRRVLPESIAVELIPAGDLVSVYADPGQLEQVILNLCVNARDAMEEGGQLTIETQNVELDDRFCASNTWATPGRYVQLCVSDNGTGMTQEVRERAFEPFFTTKEVHRGTGLGLSTVYGIVRQHQGMVQIDSTPGEGTTFRLYLPADARLPNEVDPRPDTPPARGQETILVAEDDAAVRRVVVRLLQRAGYRTLEAANGLEAFQLLRERPEPVHLALLDVIMPERGGPEAWERMQKLRPDLRVLFTSGYADGSHRERLPLDAEVLAKPYETAELLQRIRRKLDE